MKKSKNWMKYICYFIIGFLIYTIFASIIQVDILKELKMEMNIKKIVLYTMKSGIVLYTIIYFLILVLNIIYNLQLIKKLNEESVKIRKVDTEKILEERRSINMKKKVLIKILITILILSLVIMIILFFNMKNWVYIEGAEIEQKQMLIKHLNEENDELKREIDELNERLGVE